MFASLGPGIKVRDKWLVIPRNAGSRQGLRDQEFVGTHRMCPRMSLPGQAFTGMTRRSYDRDSDGYSGVASLGTTILLFEGILRQWYFQKSR